MSMWVCKVSDSMTWHGMMWREVGHTYQAVHVDKWWYRHPCWWMRKKMHQLQVFDLTSSPLHNLSKPWCEYQLGCVTAWASVVVVDVIIIVVAIRCFAIVFFQERYLERDVREKKKQQALNTDTEILNIKSTCAPWSKLQVCACTGTRKAVPSTRVVYWL